jgi:hypothetical protein
VSEITIYREDALLAIETIIESLQEWPCETSISIGQLIIRGVEVEIQLHAVTDESDFIDDERHYCMEQKL